MRYHDWPERLFKVIKNAQSSEFEWGKNDCALFAFGCVRAMTGIDYLVDFRGRYKSRKGAMTALRDIGGVKRLPELADKFLGDRISLTEAQRGDIVLVTIDSLEALGVVAGSYAVFLAPDGIRTILLGKCTCAWRVK